MGSFTSTSQFVALPFKEKKLEFLGNVISFDKNASDEEIINTIVNSNCDRIQTYSEPNKEEIEIIDIPKVEKNYFFFFGERTIIILFPSSKNLGNLTLMLHMP